MCVGLTDGGGRRGVLCGVSFKSLLGYHLSFSDAKRLPCQSNRVSHSPKVLHLPFRNIVRRSSPH